MSSGKASGLKNIGHTLAPWALPVLLLAVWQLSVSAGWLSTRILPAPSAVITAGVELVRSGEIWKHLAISGWRAGLGFVIGGSIGLALSIQRYGLSNNLGYVDVLSFLYIGSAIAMAIFVGLALVVTARPVPEPEIVALDFSIVVACFTMSSHTAWEHQYGVLLGAYALTFSLILLRLGGRARVAMTVVTGLSYLLTSQYWPVTTRLADTRANVAMSYLLIGSIILVAVMVVLRRQLTRAVPASAPTAEVPSRSMATMDEPAWQEDNQPPRRPARALPEPDAAVGAPAQGSGQTSSA